MKNIKGRNKKYEYKTKKNLYSSNSFAHEAIRPTDLSKMNEKDKLYSLIRNQTLKSLMSCAEVEETLVKIKTPFPHLFFERKFSTLLFDGFLKLEKKEKQLKEKIPKKLKPYSSIELKEVPKKYISSYHEGNIIKKLEELKIGRPSTFASFLSKIQSRHYVHKKDIEYIYLSDLSSDNFNMFSFNLNGINNAENSNKFMKISNETTITSKAI